MLLNSWATDYYIYAEISRHTCHKWNEIYISKINWLNFCSAHMLKPISCARASNKSFSSSPFRYPHIFGRLVWQKVIRDKSRTIKRKKKKKKKNKKRNIHYVYKLWDELSSYGWNWCFRRDDGIAWARACVCVCCAHQRKKNLNFIVSVDIWDANKIATTELSSLLSHLDVCVCSNLSRNFQLHVYVFLYVFGWRPTSRLLRTYQYQQQRRNAQNRSSNIDLVIRNAKIGVYWINSSSDAETLFFHLHTSNIDFFLISFHSILLWLLLFSCICDFLFVCADCQSVFYSFIFSFCWCSA